MLHQSHKNNKFTNKDLVKIVLPLKIVSWGRTRLDHDISERSFAFGQLTAG